MKVQHRRKTYLIEHMKYEELLILKTEILEDISQIKNDIEKAKTDERFGEPLDRSWLNNAKLAQKHKSDAIQAINQLLSQTRKNKNDSVDRNFVQIAKERLPDGLWREIMEKALGFGEDNPRPPRPVGSKVITEKEG